jgi:hypothetical protein
MDPTVDVSPKTHFHIHWAKNDRLDWQGFATRHEALSRALEIAGRGEIFEIVEVSEPCRLCGARASSAS